LFEDDDHEDVVMDHHYYQAFTRNPSTDPQAHCDEYETIAKNLTETIKYDIWIGEWSLATDICAMWLNGFNDLRNPPQFECNWVDCPYSYLPKDQAVDFDRTADILGPFGGKLSTGACIQKGKCSTDSKFFSFDQVNKIAKCAMGSWNDHVQGSFFWTAHNEIDVKWDYIRAWDLGWINPD
jgi:glucan 1,3-beta-glucosidase